MTISIKSCAIAAATVVASMLISVSADTQIQGDKISKNVSISFGGESAKAGSFARFTGSGYSNQEQADLSCKALWMVKSYGLNPFTIYLNLAPNDNFRKAVPKYTPKGYHVWAHMQKKVCVINDGHPI
jgi:phosphate-selective porin